MAESELDKLAALDISESAHPTEDKKPPPTLLSLAAELRNDIYRHVVVSPNPVEVTWTGHFKERRFRRFLKWPHNITSVSRQFRDEVSSIYFSENCFRFYLKDINALAKLEEAIERWNEVSDGRVTQIKRVELRLPTIVDTKTAQSTLTGTKWLKRFARAFPPQIYISATRSPTKLQLGLSLFGVNVQNSISRLELCVCGFRQLFDWWSKGAADGHRLIQALLTASKFFGAKQRLANSPSCKTCGKAELCELREVEMPDS